MPYFPHTAYVDGSNKHLDRDLDQPHHKHIAESLTKTQVWAMKAMHANDQLRQRMAWALSQIFVTIVDQEFYGTNLPRIDSVRFDFISYFTSFGLIQY